jgi:hypothetical protein
MNKFAESLISPDDFYALLPHYIKELTIEKLHRFIEKQDTYSYKSVDSLDKYFRLV